MRLGIMAWPPYRVEKGDHFIRFSSHRNYPQDSYTRPCDLPYGNYGPISLPDRFVDSLLVSWANSASERLSASALTFFKAATKASVIIAIRYLLNENMMKHSCELATTRPLKAGRAFRKTAITFHDSFLHATADCLLISRCDTMRTIQSACPSVASSRHLGTYAQRGTGMIRTLLLST